MDNAIHSQPTVSLRRQEPLRVDLLVVKKRSDAVIENEIGRIFRKFNILEYKSPEDDIRRFLAESEKLETPGDRNNADAVLQVSISANEAMYEKVKESMQMWSLDDSFENWESRQGIG